ncbi:hypothetical protein ABVK25_008445 [Lepraria finkii]|uniref:Uncharacterized protein n=1 Tax=Lepraria finkii TaxID=1340010 RepID=A0ABR4B1C3_9LECA
MGPTNRLYGTGTIGSRSPQNFHFLFDPRSGDIILTYFDGSANDASSYNFAGTSLHKTHTEGFAGQTGSGPV